MNFTVSDLDGIKIVRIKGKLDVNRSIELETELETMITGGVNKLLFDLEAIEFLSSSGLRIFIATMRTLKDNKGKLVFCSVPPMVRKLFKIVELDNIFETYDNAEEALVAFTDL